MAFLWIFASAVVALVAAGVFVNHRKGRKPDVVRLQMRAAAHTLTWLLKEALVYGKSNILEFECWFIYFCDLAKDRPHKKPDPNPFCAEDLVPHVISECQRYLEQARGLGSRLDPSLSSAEQEQITRDRVSRAAEPAFSMLCKYFITEREDTVYDEFRGWEDLRHYGLEKK